MDALWREIPKWAKTSSKRKNQFIANLGAVYVVEVSSVAFAIRVRQAKAILYVAIVEHMYTKPRPNIWSDRRGVDLLNSTIEIAVPQKIRKDEQ